MVPACYATPFTAQQVANVIATAKAYQCPFAIRGGGHSADLGASNSPGGITLNLGALNSTDVSKNMSSVSVGAGQRWGNVYTALGLLNLTAVGGREYPVGVAGFTLGGGISYFSGLYGLACDNVLNYEVVLANGHVVNANRTGPYSDLFKGLRGGSNNLGVVTRFDLVAYQQGLMYGGFVTYSDSPSVQKALLKAFVKFCYDQTTDPRAATFLSIDYTSNNYGWGAGPSYTQPVVQSTVFDDFYTPELEAAKQVDLRKITTHTELAVELAATQPYGRRQQFYTASFEPNEELLNKMFQIWRDEVKRVLAIGVKSPTGLSATFAVQPISVGTMKLMAKNGGNVLGLAGRKKPLFVLSMAWPWDSPEDDDLIMGAEQNIIDKCVAVATQMGLFNQFLYTNYAAADQESKVIAGYGQQNVKFLRALSKKYDPEGVFQKLVPGGSKLPPN